MHTIGQSSTLVKRRARVYKGIIEARKQAGMIEADKATSEILAEMDALSAALSLEDRQVCEEGSQPKRVEEQEDT